MNENLFGKYDCGLALHTEKGVLLTGFMQKMASERFLRER